MSKGGRFRFDVQILAPVTKGLLVHYQGWLAEADPERQGLIPVRDAAAPAELR